MAIIQEEKQERGEEAHKPGMLIKEVWGGRDPGEDGTSNVQSREASGPLNCWSVVSAEMRASPRSIGQEQLEGKEAGEYQQRYKRRNRTGSMRSIAKGLQSGRDLCMFKAQWMYGCNLLFFFGVKFLGIFTIS